MFVALSIAVRRILGLPTLWVETQDSALPCIRDGGFWWFPDLIAPDPTLILPVVTFVSYLVNLEVFVFPIARFVGSMLNRFEKINGLLAEKTDSRVPRIMKNLMRGVIIASFPFMWNLPSVC